MGSRLRSWSFAGQWVSKLELGNQTKHALLCGASASPRKPPAPFLQQVDGKQQEEGYDEHHGRYRRRAGVVVLLQLGDDEQRRDLRNHRHVARYEYNGAVLADGTGEGES